MEQHLFNGMSWHDYKAIRARRAYESVLALSDNVFADGLEDALERIRHEDDVALPKLDFSKRHGKRRTATHRGGDGREYSRSVVDVSIPYTGDKIGFALSPSTKTLGCRGDCEHGQLTISLDDNDRLEQELEAAVKAIEGNLTHAANDHKSMAVQIEQAIESAVSKRKEEIQRKAELDSKRSFPID